MSGALPASRLSDGTIRFIALLTILCHPKPPPLICIEEPEIAMHPDSQDLVVQLLKRGIGTHPVDRHHPFAVVDRPPICRTGRSGRLRERPAS